MSSPRCTVVAISAASACLVACHRPRSPAPAAVTTAARVSPSVEPEASPEEPATDWAGLHFLAVGGGATPESTEVSLEQDIDLVTRTLPRPGRILFAGGSASNSVREIDPESRGDPVLVELGNLFGQRSGRTSRYRRVHLEAERASLENVESRLSEALSGNGEPLLLYIAAHGDQGDTPRDDSIALWGGLSLSVTRLAEIHERHSRPLRLVVTSCFSGGFAELAFAHADEHAGPATVRRCGLFAGTWDRETSGCDANPDRRAQESYGLHFIRALSRLDKAGNSLPDDAIDFDRDGRVGLLDAHTRATISSVSYDVPTTTSERWLRKVEHGKGPIDSKASPENAAVIAQLGKALALPDEAAVERRWNAVEAHLDDLDDALDDAESDLEARTAALSSKLLEKWPMLDDAFHPDFRATFEKNRDAIEGDLEKSPEAKARTEAQGTVDAADARVEEVEVEEARVLRLRRAYETIHKASALLARGGRAAEYYRALLACERAPP